MFKNFGLLLSIVVIVSACGFKLRGVTAVFPEDLAVIVNADKKTVSPQVSQALKSQLEQQGSRSTLKVFLLDASFSSRVLVLDKNARPIKQLMVLKVDYQYSNDKKLHGVDHVNLSRNYLVDLSELATKSQFESSIKRQLLAEAASRIKDNLVKHLAENQ